MEISELQWGFWVNPPPAPPEIPDPPPPIWPAVENNPDKDDLRAKAAEWIFRNPEAYAYFEKFSLQMANAGRQFGIGLVAERVRWECYLKTTDEDGYKINNNYRAYIARKLVSDHPEIRPFLQFRKTRY